MSVRAEFHSTEDGEPPHPALTFPLPPHPWHPLSLGGGLATAVPFKAEHSTLILIIDQL